MSASRPLPGPAPDRRPGPSRLPLSGRSAPHETRETLRGVRGELARLASFLES